MPRRAARNNASVTRARDLEAGPGAVDRSGEADQPAHPCAAVLPTADAHRLWRLIPLDDALSAGGFQIANMGRPDLHKGRSSRPMNDALRSNIESAPSY